MTVLKIQNDYSCLITDDVKLKETLYNALRFKEKGYYHSMLYKQKRWDGYRNFFSEKTGKFLTGLLPEVLTALKMKGVEYEVKDFRSKVNFITKEIDQNWLDGVTLRDYQVDLINAAIKYKRGIIYAPTSAGKAQPLDSLVATPNGFVKMRKIKLGDSVLIPSGGSSKVIGIFPQGRKKILEIKFSNGDTVECCEDHLWKVNATYDGWSGKIKSAKELMDKHICPNNSKRYNIDLPKCVDFNKKNTFIKPYLMGLLLGDGSFLQNSVKLHNKDEEVLNWVRNNLKKGYFLKHRSKCDYGITCGKRGKGTPKNPYVTAIKKLELNNLKSYEKFIPQEYLINNQKNRLELLQGLMDTDGTVCKKGRISFCTTSKKLSEDIKWLIQSLGGIAFISTTKKKYTYKNKKKNGRLAFVVHFTLPEGVVPFKMSRKIKRCKLTRTRNKHRVISEIKEIGYKECQCILIEHPEHLYLTDNFVITHNTNIMLGFMKTIEPNTPTLFLANRKTLVHQNWKEMNEAGIEAGRLYDKYNEKKPIMCATVQSLHKIEDMLQDFKVLIVDEIHEMTSAGPKKAYNKLKGASVRLAVSATPFKFGGKDACQKYTVKGYFGPVFKSNAGMSDGILTTKKLQEKSILSASKCTFYHVNEPQIPYAIYLDAVTQGIAESYHFHDIVRDLAMTLTGRTLILVERIPHGDALFNMIPNALWIQGKDDLETREYVINELKENKKGVIGIATQQIFNTGVNVYVNNLINAAGGKAEHLIIQRMGRGLRTADDKSILNYYDFIFNINDYLLQHSNKRVKILKDEGHDVTIKKHLDFRK